MLRVGPRLAPRLAPAARAAASSRVSSAPGLAQRSLSSTAKRVLEITDEQEYDDALASSKGLAVVYFTAAWCGPCQMIKPIYEQLADDNPESTFLKVDVDECADVAARAEVRAMPTFQFVKEGKLLDTLVGADPGKLLQYITNHSK